MSTVAETMNKGKPSALVPTKPLTQMDELRNTWTSLEGKANLVSPVAMVDSIPEMHAISLRAVMIDPATNKFGQGPEVYRDARFCESDEVALGGVALQKIAAAAGVQILQRRRLDDRRDPNYCEIEITIGIRDFDGTWRQVTKTKEIDLRDGAPETLKSEKDSSGRKTGNMIPLEPSALGDRRRHIQSMCETKAFYRALRTILTLRQKYTKAELAKPFIVPKLIPALDPNDPDQKNALIQMAVGREAGLYGTLTSGQPEPPRTLKDVTPTRESVAPPSPETAPRPETRGEPEVSEADFEPLEFPEEEPGPPAICSCPCGCQQELTEEVARIGTEKIGTPRCRACYPARSFDPAKHKDVGDLEIPKMPGLTAARVIAGLKKGGAR